MGYFNNILFCKEKIGGALGSLSKMMAFKDCVFDYGLLDLQSYGLSYTWSNLQVDNPIFYRINRVTCNSLWLEAFPYSFYHVDAPLSLDHSPLIINFQMIRDLKHHFLFCNYCTKHHSFLNVISLTWQVYMKGDPIFILSNKLKLVRNFLKHTN